MKKLIYISALCLSVTACRVSFGQENTNLSDCFENESVTTVTTDSNEQMTQKSTQMSESAPDSFNADESHEVIQKNTDDLKESEQNEDDHRISSHERTSEDNELSKEEEQALLAALAEDTAENSEDSWLKNAGNNIVAAIQSMNPDMAITGDFALAWFSESTNFQSGAHDPTSTGFQLQQLEMTLGASVDHIFRMDANLVFSLSGVELEEAYVTTLGLPWSLQLRAGQFLSRFGRINPTHPHTWDFVDQPFVIGKFFGSEGNRGLGVELSWLTPLPWYLEIVGSAQMATSNASNRSYLGSNGKTDGVQDFLYTLSIKQFFQLHDSVGMYWGLSAQTGPNSTGKDNRTNIFGTDLHLKYSPQTYPEMSLVFQTEAMFRLRQIPGELNFDGAGYAQIVWQIDRNWATGVRGEYGSGMSTDDLDAFWTDDRWRVTLQATWFPSHFSRLRAQASVDMPKWQKDPIYALFLALEFTAGTHPAHNY